MKTFSSSKGVVLNLKPVSQFKIDSLRASKVDVKPPVYITKTVAGETMSVPMDADMAEHQGRMPEWNLYLEKKKKEDSEFAKRFLEMVVYDGIEVEVPGPDSEWQKLSERFGLTVPSDPVERKMFYVYNELIGTGDDLKNLMTAIFTASSVPDEVIQRIQYSFRSGIQGNTDRPVAKTHRKLVHKQ